MKRSQQVLKGLVEKYYQNVSHLEIEYFFRIVGDIVLPYVEYEDEIWFPATIISQSLGKDSRDYAANYIKNKRDKKLKGIHRRFSNPEEKNYIAQQLKSKFPASKLPKSKFHTQRTSWFINWERAHDYISRSSYAFKKSKRANPEVTKVFVENGILYISSFEIADRLSIKHTSLIKMIQKYEQYVQAFGFLIEKELTELKEVHNRSTVYNKVFYLLTEDQAYLIAALARNSEKAIDFKCWLVSQFSRARNLKSEAETSTIYTEEVIHSQLAQLSLYSNLSVQSEYPLPLSVKRGSKTVNLIKRIDLFIDRKVAIELKNDAITPHILNDIITNRGYLETLSLIPTFKYMIISSPQGVSQEAQKMLDLLFPKIIFKYPTEIGDQMAKRILKEYPKQSHWWLKKFIFPKFNKVLSPSFIQSLNNVES